MTTRESWKTLAKTCVLEQSWKEAICRFSGDPKLAALYLPIARKVLGGVVQQTTLGGIEQGHRIIHLPDGAIIRVIKNNDIRSIEIDVTEVNYVEEPPPVSLFDFHLFFNGQFFNQDGDALNTMLCLNTKKHKMSIKPTFFSERQSWIDNRVLDKESALTWSQRGGIPDYYETSNYLYKNAQSAVYENGQGVFWIDLSVVSAGRATEYDYVLCAGKIGKKIAVLLSSGKIVLDGAVFLSGTNEEYDNSYITTTLPISITNFSANQKLLLQQIPAAWTDVARFSFSQDGTKILAYLLSEAHFSQLSGLADDPRQLWAHTLGHIPVTLYECTVSSGTWNALWTAEILADNMITALNQPYRIEVPNPYVRPQDVYSYNFQDQFPGLWSSPFYSYERTDNNYSYTYIQDILISADYVNNEVKKLVARFTATGSLINRTAVTRHGCVWAFADTESLKINFNYIPAEWDINHLFEEYFKDMYGNSTYYLTQTKKVAGVRPFHTSYDDSTSRIVDETAYIEFRYNEDSAFLSEEFYHIHYDRTTTVGNKKPPGYTLVDRVLPVSVWYITAIYYHDPETLEDTFIRYGTKQEWLNGYPYTTPPYNIYTNQTYQGDPNGFIVEQEDRYRIAIGEYRTGASGGMPWNWGVHPVYLAPNTYGASGIPKHQLNGVPANYTGTSSTATDMTGTFDDYRIDPFIYTPTYYYFGRMDLVKWYYSNPTNFVWVGKFDTSNQAIYHQGEPIFSGEHRWAINPLWLDFGNQYRGFISYTPTGDPVDDEGNPLDDEHAPYAAPFGFSPLITYRFSNPPYVWYLGGNKFNELKTMACRAGYLTEFIIKYSKFNSTIATIPYSDDIYWNQGDLIAALHAALSPSGVYNATDQLTMIHLA